MPLDSEFYIVRPTDRDFCEAIQRRDSIVLVKGARQMGKTSLLARGLQEARNLGIRVVLTDFQKLNSSHLETMRNSSWRWPKRSWNSSIWSFRSPRAGIHAVARA